MPLRQKYSIGQWVLNRDNLKVGDIVAFYCEEKKCERHAKVVGFPSQINREVIECSPLHEALGKPGDTFELNFYQTIVYRIEQEQTKAVHPPSCSCGAKFTSNPGFHLSFCEMAS